MAPLTRSRAGAALLALLLRDTNALGTNYEHDGVTTYCWAIPRPPNLTNLTESDRTTAYSTRVECPVALTLSLTPTDSVHAFERVNITWTAQVDFSGGNAINDSQLFYGLDMTGHVAQIVHSNIHSCVFGTGCDPFNDGEQLVDKTVNKIANFSDNAATFSDSLQFPEPGEYSVLAHIILPDYDDTSRFDYAVYSKLTVLEAVQSTTVPPTAAPIEINPTAAPVDETTSGHSGLSTGVKIAIIVGAVVVAIALVVIVYFLRRRHKQNVHSDVYMQVPAHDAGPAPMKHWEATNSTGATPSEYPSTMGVDDPIPRPSGAVYDQYVAPRPSGARGSSETSHFRSSVPPPVSYAAQQPRKKRIDSEIEL